jgi:hypothetical protein
MLQSFTGFRGIAALVRIGKIDFVIVARNAKQLEQLYTAILSQAGPFNPDACKPSIVIASCSLPKQKSHDEQNHAG